jgi:sigma-B regulation protein RsbU (phosphoserine phosphatase)
MDNLTRVTAEKERIGAELNVATQIQASMLPCIFPAFPDRDEMDIYATMTPAKEVGGDFYDFFMVDDRHMAIVMADVSGKGSGSPFHGYRQNPDQGSYTAGQRPGRSLYRGQ